MMESSNPWQVCPKTRLWIILVNLGPLSKDQVNRNEHRQTGFCYTHKIVMLLKLTFPIFIYYSWLIFKCVSVSTTQTATIAALKINITTILTLFSVVYNDFCLQDKLFYQVLVTKNMYIWWASKELQVRWTLKASSLLAFLSLSRIPETKKNYVVNFLYKCEMKFNFYRWNS